MKTSKTLTAAVTLALAAMSPLTAQAADTILLNEGFDDITNLPGWILVNYSTPVGQNWFQGNSGVFSAQSGGPDSYIGANFLSASALGGYLDNWLITPELNLGASTKLSFYTRTEAAMGKNDTLEVRFSSGAGTDITGFSTLLTTVGGANAYPCDWQQFTASTMAGGTGRFAFRYVGDAGVANFIGIDTVSITAVPEPATYLMLGLGLAALTVRRRMASLSTRFLKG